MQNTPPTPPTPKKTILPEVGRDEMLEYWGLSADHHWKGTRKWGEGPDHHRGLHSSTLDEDTRSFTSDQQDAWCMAWHGSAAFNGGLKSHRGTLHPNEYFDQEVFTRCVEVRLGFTSEQMQSVMRRGKLSAEQETLRDLIDARLLALYEEGTNMALLGEALGLHVQDDSRCRPIRNALKRARIKEQE